MAFIYEYKSVGGAYDGQMENISSLNDLIWNTPPSEDDEEMAYFVYQNSQSSTSEYGDYIYPAIVKIQGTQTLGDLYNYLFTQYADAEIDLLRIETTDEDIQLVLRAYAWDGANNVTFKLYKRVHQGAIIYTYTLLSQIDVTINDYHISDYGLFAGVLEYNNKSYLAIGVTTYDTIGTYAQVLGWCNSFDNAETLLGALPVGEKFSPDFGKVSKSKGGYNPHHRRKGTFDDSSDKITVSTAPTMNAGMSGFFHAWFVTETTLQNIGKAIFPPSVTLATDLIQAINDATNSLLNSKKVDYILDCLILPIDVPKGNIANITFGGGEMTYLEGANVRHIQGYPVSSFYVDRSCGKLSIPEYWANFLDHTGTRIKIFLPYVGYVDLQTEFLNGGEIEVKYRFNIVDGSFMCYLISTSGHSELEESMIGQYSGVACMHIPITAQDYTNKISGLISSVGAIAAGGLMGGGAGATMGAVSSLANTVAQKPQTMHANGYNASSSFLSHRKPYVIIERQSSQFSEIYPQEVGLPSYIAKPLSELHGFTVLDNPVLNISCSDEEYNEIVNYMKTGIIL